MSPGVTQNESWCTRKIDNNCMTNWYNFISYVPIIAFIEKKYPKSVHILIVCKAFFMCIFTLKKSPGVSWCVLGCPPVFWGVLG